VDEILSDLRTALRVGLAVLVDDLDVVLLATDGETVLERLAGKAEDIAIRLAEAGSRTSNRGDKTNLDRSGRATATDPSAARRARRQSRAAQGQTSDAETDGTKKLSPGESG